VSDSSIVRFAPGALVVLFVLLACGTTGHTTRAPVDLGALPVPASAELRPVAVGSVEADPSGIRLMNVGSYAWGKFDESDLANLRVSLEDTLAAATKGRTLAAEASVRVHLVIRDYVVATSNNAGAVFVGVEWYAAAGDDPCLFGESFYATSSGRFIGTIGGRKDDAHRAIVKRISLTALALAAGQRPLPAEVDGTFSSFEKAAATMPESIQSWGVPVGGTPGGYIPGTDPRSFRSSLPKLRVPGDCSTNPKR
jgi:hypothetical protein